MATKTYAVLNRIFFGAGDASEHRYLDAGDTIELDDTDESQRPTIETLIASDYIEDLANPRPRRRAERVAIGYRQVMRKRRVVRDVAADTGGQAGVATVDDHPARIAFLNEERTKAQSERASLMGELEQTTDGETRSKIVCQIDECDEAIGFVSEKQQQL